MVDQAASPAAEGPPTKRGRLLLLFLVVLATAAAAYLLRPYLSLDYLAAREIELRDLVKAQPVLSFTVAFFVYVAVTGASLPGATILSLLYAWLFGFWSSLLLVSFASTSGATLAFLLSRYLLRDLVQGRFADRLRGFNEALEREGAYYLFSLRLIPAVPFVVINLVMGLTRIPARTFWWVSQLGMLPGTCAYLYAGSELPSLHEVIEKGPASLVRWQLLVGLALLGVLPLVLRRLTKALAARAVGRK